MGRQTRASLRRRRRCSDMKNEGGYWSYDSHVIRPRQKKNERRSGERTRANSSIGKGRTSKFAEPPRYPVISEVVTPRPSTDRRALLDVVVKSLPPEHVEVCDRLHETTINTTHTVLVSVAHTDSVFARARAYRSAGSTP